MSHDAPPGLVFPAPPLTVGQQYSAPNGVTYIWDGLCWTSGVAMSVTPMWRDTGRDALTPVHEPRSLFLASGTAIAFGDPETSPCPCIRGDGDHLRLTGIGDIQCYAGGGADPVATIDAAGLHAAVGGDLEGTLPNPRLRAGLMPVLPTTLPPTGPAGGDLLGSFYPNPVLAPGAVTRAKTAPDLWLPPIPAAGDVNRVLAVTSGPALAYTTRLPALTVTDLTLEGALLHQPPASPYLASFRASSAGFASWQHNDLFAPTVLSKPSWQVKLDVDGDTVSIVRRAPNAAAGSGVPLWRIDQAQRVQTLGRSFDCGGSHPTPMLANENRAGLSFHGWRTGHGFNVSSLTSVELPQVGGGNMSAMVLIHAYAYVLGSPSFWMAIEVFSAGAWSVQVAGWFSYDASITLLWPAQSRHQFRLRIQNGPTAATGGSAYAMRGAVVTHTGSAL